MTQQAQSRTGLTLPLLLLPAAGMLACFVWMSRLTHFTRQGYTYLTAFLIASALYSIAALWLLRRPVTNPRQTLTVIVISALLFRVPLWFSEPTLSTDIWRYLWDGHLLSQGLNPYAERVDSPALDEYTTPLRSQVAHQWMATPYPPAAEVTFAGIDRIAPQNPRAMQIVFSLFDLAAAGVLILILQQLKLPPERVILYAWNPLIVVEFAHSAHVDALMTLFVLLAIYLALSGRQTWSALALAGAVLTKFVPALLLPVFVRRWGWVNTCLFVLVIMLAFLPFSGAGLGFSPDFDGTGIFGATRIYFTSWQTNDGLHYWLTKLFDSFTPDGRSIASLIGLATLGGLVLWVWLRSTSYNEDNSRHIVTHAALLISVYLLFSAALFPWYLAWLLALLPLLPFERSRAARFFTAAWLYFSAAVNLSYLFYLDPNNPGEIEWIRRVEYLPLFTLLGAGLILWRIERASVSKKDLTKGN